MGTWRKGLQVPEFADDRLVIFFVDSGRHHGAGTDTERGYGNVRDWDHQSCVRGLQPSDGKPVSFKRNQKMNFWMQVYNLSVDDKTHKPSATVEYDVVNTTTNKSVVHSVESTDTMGNIGDQMTLQKTLAAANLVSGYLPYSDQGE